MNLIQSWILFAAGAFVAAWPWFFVWCCYTTAGQEKSANKDAKAACAFSMFFAASACGLRVVFISLQ